MTELDRAPRFVRERVAGEVGRADAALCGHAHRYELARRELVEGRVRAA